MKAPLALGLLAAAACAGAQGNPSVEAVRSACRVELERHCSAAIATGDPRAAGRCLRDNHKSLSRECRGALKDLREARAAGDRGAAPATAGAAARAATAEGGQIVSYGDDPKQRLRFFPAKAPGGTLVVFVHGGGWAKGDMDSGNGMKSAAFTAAGHDFATVNYRLYPAASAEQQAADVAAAIAAAIAAADRGGQSPARVVLMGHSAGAHLAALVALDDRYLAAAGVPAGRVAGVTLLDGAGYDVPGQIASGGNVELYRTIFGADPKVWAMLSPLTHAASAADGPAFLIHHIASREGAGRQARSFADAITRAGGTAKVVAAEGKTHASINREFGQPGDGVTGEVLAFVADLATQR